MALSRETAIVGIGQTEFSKHSGRSELQLAGEAVAAAIADAGLTPADIDGAVTFAMDVNDELAVMRCAGIPSLRFTARTRGGGGGACATVQLASADVTCTKSTPPEAASHWPTPSFIAARTLALSAPKRSLTQ